MALQLTLSCDSDKTESGPVLIHSTGVKHYKIPPDVVGTQEFLRSFDAKRGFEGSSETQRIVLHY